MPKKKNYKAKKPKQDGNVLTDVMQHYMMAKENLETRLSDFNQKDELFHSYISDNRDKHPYDSMVFDPRTWTFVIEKSSRLIGSKPKGRLTPREGGDEVGAKINNEVLSFYWDEASRVNDETMIAKWVLMDQRARRYGASFGLVPYHYQTFTNRKTKKREVWYDGPYFQPWNNRDVLPNPSYSTIKHWVQLRKYTTLQELESVNDTAKTGPVYKNLDVLRDRMREESKLSGDRRDTNYQSKILEMRGLSDMLGRDESFRVVEVITEYRNDRWITFAPKHGVILRDIPNPYDHQQIPVVRLAYYPIEDDIYGMAEIEPIEKLQKATNALINQYLDTINTDLYPPLLVDPKRVRMHTLEFGANKKWIVNSAGPGGIQGAVQRFQTSTAATAQFTQTYSFMISSMMNAIGESSLGVSNLPGTNFNPDKTATEVRSLEFSKNARDNFNQIYLEEALKKQMMMWHKLAKQYMFSTDADQQKVIRIVGKEALKYFQDLGFDQIHPTDEDIQREAGEQNPLLPQDVVAPGPSFPVVFEGKIQPKLIMDETEQSGRLVVEEGDLSGNYDYIPDIESFQQPSEQQIEQKVQQLIGIATNPQIQQAMAAEGKRIKVSELVKKAIELSKVTGDAEQYVEAIPEEEAAIEQGAKVNQAGIAAGEAGGPGQAVAGASSVAGNGQALPNGADQQLLG